MDPRRGDDTRRAEPDCTIMRHDEREQAQEPTPEPGSEHRVIDQPDAVQAESASRIDIDALDMRVQSIEMRDEELTKAIADKTPSASFMLIAWEKIASCISSRLLIPLPLLSIL